MWTQVLFEKLVAQQDNNRHKNAISMQMVYINTNERLATVGHAPVELFCSLFCLLSDDIDCFS